MDVDLTRWSGEGAFTQALVDALRQFEEIELVRVEDAPASRSDPGYAFISNEIFVRFRRRPGARPWWRLAAPRPVKTLTLGGVEAALEAHDGIGAPDYADDGMLQYLRTERIVPPYQTRGVKLVEMVRVYEAGKGPRA